jgi:hypothetical protein
LDELREYELNTVTYGLKCAPFLALRALKEIAVLEVDDATEISKVLLTQTYINDIYIGAEKVAELLRLQTTLIETLKPFGLELKKWTINSPEILEAIPSDHRTAGGVIFGDTESVPVLGMTWLPDKDFFRFVAVTMKTVATKRDVLLTAHVFDPIGLLTHVIFLARYLMQGLWRAKVSWYDLLPGKINVEWLRFMSEIPKLSDILILRFIGICSNCQYYLCKFCDASEKGYSAVVYLHVTTPGDEIHTFLLRTKRKFAP